MPSPAAIYNSLNAKLVAFLLSRLASDSLLVIFMLNASISQVIRVAATLFGSGPTFWALTYAPNSTVLWFHLFFRIRIHVCISHTAFCRQTLISAIFRQRRPWLARQPCRNVSYWYILRPVISRPASLQLTEHRRTSSYFITASRWLLHVLSWHSAASHLESLPHLLALASCRSFCAIRPYRQNRLYTNLYLYRRLTRWPLPLPGAIFCFEEAVRLPPHSFSYRPTRFTRSAYRSPTPQALFHNP